MSKPIKNLITRAYETMFADFDGGVVVDIRGIPSNENNAFRGRLAQKQIKVTVVKNSLARKAFADTLYEPVNPMLEGPCAMVYGGESVVHVARELVEAVKEHKGIALKGAVMDGLTFGPDEIERLSKFPTRQEALSQVIQVMLGAAGQLLGAINSPGGQIVSILDTIIDKQENAA